MAYDFHSLSDISRRKAELQAQLDEQSKQIKACRKSLLTKHKAAKGGLTSLLRPSNLLASADAAWLVWKLYRKIKRK